MNRIMRENIENNNLTSISSNSNIDNSNVSKFIGDNVSSSPLENLLSNFELTNYICIYMLIILIIQILFKIHFKDDIKLDLTSIIGEKLNNGLEFYINKIIQINKKNEYFLYLIHFNLSNFRIILIYIHYKWHTK